ncbi:DMT family transporter [Rickettsiales bacterium]|nr:DMT family transporter [Rickettsiales bacterium]
MTAAAFWFSVMASLIRHISADLSPFEMVFFRNLFAFICLLPWAYNYGFKRIRTNRWKLYAGRSVSGLAGMIMIFYALSIIPLTDVIALTFTVPLISTIMAVMFLKENVDFHRWLALLFGFIGVLVVLRPGTEAFQWASLLVIATTFCWSCSNIFVKKLTSTDQPRVILFLMLLLMVPLSFPLATIHWQTPTLNQLGLLFILGWVTNMAQLCMTNSYAATDMSAVQPFDFARLIFTSIIAWIFFEETLNIWTGFGAIIIFGSSVYVTQRAKSSAAKGLL